VFRDLVPREEGVAKAIVADPCVWSPELPHLYQVDVVAQRSERVIAEYHGKIGLRRKGGPR
jgi:beta-galactosidase/beta-glucuronidase